MGEPYVGEIRMFGGNFAPAGWMLCEGQPLPISENDVLFTLIGTTYGGDGQETFNLPNLAGRFPMHMGTGPSGATYQIGEIGGSEEVTLTVQQIPSHVHPVTATSANGGQSTPVNNVFAAVQSGNAMYNDQAPNGTMNAAAVTGSGGSQPHENLAPYLCINFIISLFGRFPSQT
jgi:microcystin-dependent protein